MLFFSTGIISANQIHLYLALFLHRDYFGRQDSSLSCSFSPQGLFQPARFISILLFFSTGIISASQIHLYLALLCYRDYFGRPDSSLSCSFLRRDYFHRPDSSLACSFSPQGLFQPARFISILLFFSTGIISPRSDASLSCSFALQRLFQPPGFIPIWLFCSTGIISTTRIHPYLALLLRRDYFAPVRYVPHR